MPNAYLDTVFTNDFFQKYVSNKIEIPQGIKTNTLVIYPQRKDKTENIPSKK